MKTTTIDKHYDERGFFYEVWRGNPPMDIKQVNISFSKRGVIRGIHFEPWNKYIHVVSGSVLCCIVDKNGNTEFHQLTGNEAIFVPKGYGNSFQALEDTYYLYIVDGLWKPGKKYKSLPATSIDWPIKDWIVSAKDA